MKTEEGLEFKVMNASYLAEIQKKMPLEVINAKCHIANCGRIIVYAEKNQYFDCYEPIDNEYYLEEIYNLLSL